MAMDTVGPTEATPATVAMTYSSEFACKQRTLIGCLTVSMLQTLTCYRLAAF